MTNIKAKINKFIVIYLTIILILFSSQIKAKAVSNESNPDINQNTSNLSEQVRVGLFFKDKNFANSSTESSYFSVSAAKGLEVGYNSNGNFNKIFEIADNYSLIVRKDAYYLIKDNSIKEYKPSSGNIANDNKLGPFHIQLGGSCDSYETAKAKIEIYKQKGVNAYAAFTDSWYIWTGFYIDQNSAESDILNVINKNFGKGDHKVVQPSVDNIVINDGKSGQPIMIFGGKDAFLHIKPKVDNNQYIFNINGKNYRGTLEVRRYASSDMTVINILPIEHYLYSVVPSEIQWMSHPEALKAQAITARTYVYSNLGKYSSLGFDVCSTVYSQVYGGYAVERETTNKAVDETQDKKLYYNSELAQVFFFSSSGGKTEASKNVWTADLPYLQSVEDNYEDKNSKNYTWEKVLSVNKVRDIMVSKGNDVGEVDGIEIINTSEAGRVIELVVSGTSGDKVFVKARCRELFDLPSQWYTISTDADAVILSSSDQMRKNIQVVGKKVITRNGLEDNKLNREISILGDNNVIRTISSIPTSYIFTGRGYGHAVGMSQQGAKGMADAGFLYDEILQHYFLGTSIE